MKALILEKMHLSGFSQSDFIANNIILLMLLAIGFGLYLVLHVLLIPAFRKRMGGSRHTFLNVLGHSKLLHFLLSILMGLILQVLAEQWYDPGAYQTLVLNFLKVFVLFFVMLSGHALIDVLSRAALKSPQLSSFPIRGLAQTLKLAVTLAIVLLMIALLLGKSPVLILSGLGAMTAVLMLVFKDPIMGLVAGIQLSANNMLSLGDWLEMPKYNAEGEVIDIGLTTVKVKNSDNTMTSLPTYALISDSFKNWRSLSESGARRMMRSINIDVKSVRFINEDDLKHFSKSELLAPYIKEKYAEVEQYNKVHAVDSILDARNLTNIGTFRAYLEAYLKHHPRIRQDLTLMVRQLEPTDKGLPLQIYAYTNTAVWVEFETIQADIFDHIMSVIPSFELRIFQNINSADITGLFKGIEQLKK